MALSESPGDHGITHPSQLWRFWGSQKVTPLSPLHGFFHISVLLLMKQPASWHSSFHSGYQDSVEKYISQLWLKQGKNTLIPSAVHSSGDPNPLNGFVYLQNTVSLKAPSAPTLWRSLTFRSVSGEGRGTAGAVDSDMDAEWWREVLLEGKTDRQGSGGTHRGRRLRTEGAGGRDQLVGCYVGTPGCSHRRQREKKGEGRRKKSRRCRGSAWGTASSDVSECHKHTARLWTQKCWHSRPHLKNGFVLVNHYHLIRSLLSKENRNSIWRG